MQSVTHLAMFSFWKLLFLCINWDCTQCACICIRSSIEGFLNIISVTLLVIRSFSMWMNTKKNYSLLHTEWLNIRTKKRTPTMQNPYQYSNNLFSYSALFFHFSFVYLLFSSLQWWFPDHSRQHKILMKKYYGYDYYCCDPYYVLLS